MDWPNEFPVPNSTLHWFDNAFTGFEWYSEMYPLIDDGNSTPSYRENLIYLTKLLYDRDDMSNQQIWLINNERLISRIEAITQVGCSVFNLHRIFSGHSASENQQRKSRVICLLSEFFIRFLQTFSPIRKEYLIYITLSFKYQSSIKDCNPSTLW